MRCNCQISLSRSFDLPRFKLRSHKNRINNTITATRPKASVPKMIVTRTESEDMFDGVMLPPGCNHQRSKPEPATNYCACTSGICDETCSSSIIAIRRSSWKKVADFFPSSTLDTIGTYFCRRWAVSMSASNHRRINDRDCSFVNFPQLSAYS